MQMAAAFKKPQTSSDVATWMGDLNTLANIYFFPKTKKKKISKLLEEIREMLDLFDVRI